MVAILNLFLPLLIQILILYALSQMVDRLVLKRLGRGWYLATMWPGVIIHELSHLVGCVITFTRVHKVRLFAPSGTTLGYVQHARTHNPIKNIIISIAPLFGVTAVIWLLTKWLWPDLYAVQVSAVQSAAADFSSWENFFAFTGSYFNQYWSYIADLFSRFDFGLWQTYVFIFLMLSLSSHAAPSRADLKYTYYGLFGVAALFYLIYVLDQWLQIPITWTIIEWLTHPIYLAAGFLTYGVIFAALSLIIMSIISLVAWPIKRG